MRYLLTRLLAHPNHVLQLFVQVPSLQQISQVIRPLNVCVRTGVLAGFISPPPATYPSLYWKTTPSLFVLPLLSNLHQRFSWPSLSLFTPPSFPSAVSVVRRGGRVQGLIKAPRIPGEDVFREWGDSNSSLNLETRAAGRRDRRSQHSCFDLWMSLMCSAWWEPSTSSFCFVP